MALSAATLALLEAQIGRAAREPATTGGIWVGRVTLYDWVTGSTATLYESSEQVTTNATDTPAHTPLGTGRLHPPSLEQGVSGDGMPIASGLPSVLLQGPIKLDNPDGALDRRDSSRPQFAFDETYAWEGATFELLYGSLEDAQGGNFATGFEVVQTFQIRFYESGPQTITLHAVDGAGALDLPVQSNLYVSNEFGSLPASLIGQRKPLLWGAFTGAQPVLIDAANLIYQLNDDARAALTSISTVYEGGASVGASDGDVADIAALRNHTFVNQYVTALAVGCFRLRATPAKEVTVDGVGMSPGPGYSFGQIALDISNNYVSPTPTLATGAFTGGWWGFNGGLYLDGRSDDRARETLARLAPPLHAIFQNRDGKLATFQITADPFDEATSLVLTADEVKDWRREKTAAPLWETLVSWGRVWSPLTDFTGSVNAGEQARQSAPLRWFPSANPAIQTAYGASARSERFETLLVSEADARTIAETIQRLFERQRHLVALDLAARFSAYDLGTRIEYTEDRAPFRPAGGTIDDEAGVPLTDEPGGVDLTDEDEPYHAVICGWIERPPSEYTLEVWL